MLHNTKIVFAMSVVMYVLHATRGELTHPPAIFREQSVPSPDYPPLLCSYSFHVPCTLRDLYAIITYCQLSSQLYTSHPWKRMPKLPSPAVRDKAVLSPAVPRLTPTTGSQPSPKPCRHARRDELVFAYRVRSSLTTVQTSHKSNGVAAPESKHDCPSGILTSITQVL